MGDIAPDVSAYLEKISSPTRRRDAETMVELLGRVTGEAPKMWGSIVGFGAYHYKYESGREGDSPAAAFAARKAATTIYAPDGIGRYEKELAKLGPHTTGVGCLYVKDLTRVDLEVLEEILGDSYRRLSAGTYDKRARDTD